MRILLAAALVLALADSAEAMRCTEWQSLTPEQKETALDDMAAKRLQSGVESEWNVDTGSVARCLAERRQEIMDAFDDACAEGERAAMDALDRIFMQYLRSCAG